MSLFLSFPAGADAADEIAAVAPSAKVSEPEAAHPSAIVRALRNDAALADICFINQSSGWAVGDRGVIWHSDDGGATWKQQSSPVSCGLKSVFFVDGRRGFSVGGESRPHSAATRGVVLRTDDGGTTWTQVPRLVLPRLTGVKFFDRERGIAFGQSASFSPSGVFVTHDGGESWQPLSADRAGDWLAGDFLDPDIGALAGPAGQIATLARRQVVHSPLATASLRSFRAMRLVEPTGGWAVGDGGLLVTTHDLGRSWQTPPTDLPQAAADHFDFHAVAVKGPHVWVAGSPGTRIFHSPDGGQTWQTAATGQSSPLRALSFVDAEHGWAAGELGLILATHDGGQSWQVQRSGGQRAALLAIFANPSDVPLELLADSGAADGYISAVDILCTSADDAQNTSNAATERWQEAMLLSGAATTNTAWRFPLPAADLALAPADLLEALNRENDGRAIQQLQSHLVRELRMWRPDVVVTHHDVTGNGEPIAALIEQLVMRSVEAAADSAQHVELAADIGLPPWQVKKVYGVLPPGSRGDEVLAAGRFSPWLGAALSDFVSPARDLLFATHAVPQETYELKLLMNRAPDNANARGLFSGISLAPGSDARRQQPDLPVQDLESLRRLAARRRNLQGLMERSEGNAAWTGQVANMIDGLSADDGGQLLVQLAEGYRKSGRLDLAADTYFLFARRYPDHPLADQALTWLVQFYASDEAAQRSASRGLASVRQAAVDQADSTQPDASDRADGVKQASAVTIGPDVGPAVGLSHNDRLRRAVQLADYLKTARPALYAEPSVRFAEIIAQRKLGFANPAKRFFLTLGQLPENDPWRQCAATEEWLSQPADQPPPKKLAACRPAGQPPQLDGKLDEPFWEKADHLHLHGDPSRSRLSAGGDVQLAYDSKFLYIGVRCNKVASVGCATDDSPRPRDADLMQHDRVELQFDTDRDFSTAFELTVDNRGWTRDTCWGDASWDPTWYVAATSDENTWTVEAAVPLAELVDKPPAARHVWAVAARRTIPRVGYETWAGQPSSDDSPDRFGLLIFE